MLPLVQNCKKRRLNKIFTKVFPYIESGSGSINGVAPKGSIFASNILLIIELPAIEAASPALKPGHKNKNIQYHISRNNRERASPLFPGLIPNTLLPKQGFQCLFFSLIRTKHYDIGIFKVSDAS